MRISALAGAAFAALIDLVYLVIVTSEPGGVAVSLRAPFVAALIALAAGAAATAARTPFGHRHAPFLLTASAAALVALGVIAILSIGLVLLVAGAIVVVAAALAVRAQPTRSAVAEAAAGAVMAFALFAGGIAATEVPVGCSGDGYESGSGLGLFTSPYHWTCAGGRLTVAPGLCTHGGASFDSTGRITSTGDC